MSLLPLCTVCTSSLHSVFLLYSLPSISFLSAPLFHFLSYHFSPFTVILSFLLPNLNGSLCPCLPSKYVFHWTLLFPSPLLLPHPFLSSLFPFFSFFLSFSLPFILSIFLLSIPTYISCLSNPLSLQISYDDPLLLPLHPASLFYTLKESPFFFSLCLSFLSLLPSLPFPTTGSASSFHLSVHPALVTPPAFPFSEVVNVQAPFLSVAISVFLSACLSLFLSIWCLCLSVRLSVCLSVCLSVWNSHTHYQTN